VRGYVSASERGVERVACVAVLRRIRRLVVAALCTCAALSVIAIAAAWLSTDHFAAFGASPRGASLARIEASPEFVGHRFQNAEPSTVMKPGGAWRSLRHWAFGGEMRAPSCPLPLAGGTAARLRTPPASGLRVTWLGHSTTLLEIDGARILTDPIWSERASPSRWIGPKRFHPPPLALADLPPIDAVLVSHEHYDHLDMDTVRALAARGAAFHVPLGVGPHLRAWGVPAARVTEHDWWQGATLAHGVRVVSTPARHFNGRGVPGRIGALWTSWSIVGPAHRVFFSGDTGMERAFTDIAAREGPFDLSMLEIGQYHPSWGDIHLGPLGALDAHRALGAKALLPIHWATFQLGYHAWSEPAETITRAARQRGVKLLTPRLGEPIEPASANETGVWWRALPPTAARCPAEAG
jgi:L-ascorbate metabolism protein UlaG (beta-lactamase superfamily)